MNEQTPVSGLATIWPDDGQQAPIQAYFNSPVKHKYPVKWLVLWQESSQIGVSIMEQAKLENLTLSDYRIRDYLLGSIGIGNYVFVNQRELARELHLNKSTVNESIKRLIALGILLQGPKSGRSNTYAISPAFCFSGKLGIGIKERKKAINDHKAKVIPFKPNGKEPKQNTLLNS